MLRYRKVNLKGKPAMKKHRGVRYRWLTVAEDAGLMTWAIARGAPLTEKPRPGATGPRLRTVVDVIAPDGASLIGNAGGTMRR